MNLENNISILTSVEFEIKLTTTYYSTLRKIRSDILKYSQIFDLYFFHDLSNSNHFTFSFELPACIRSRLFKLCTIKSWIWKKKKLLVYEETWKSSLFRSLRVTPRNLTVSSRVNKRTYIYIGVSLANNSRLIHIYPRGRALFDSSTSLEYIGN